jgi:hypothetical protein
MSYTVSAVLASEPVSRSFDALGPTLAWVWELEKRLAADIVISDGCRELREQQLLDLLDASRS